MFYKLKIKDHISVKPEFFEEDLKVSVLNQIREVYQNKTDEEIGLVISILNIEEIGQGFKLPENPNRHFPVIFDVICYKPELHDVVEGDVTSVTNFGAFVNLGAIEGLIHLTQTMADQTSFSKTGVIQGSKTGRTLKVGDKVRAKLIANSFKDLSNIKIGLTMRQPGLGQHDWLKEDAGKSQES